MTDLKAFANTTIYSYETWQKVVEIIDDCEIYINDFSKKQYFNYLDAFYQMAVAENKDLLIVVQGFAEVMKKTLGYKLNKLRKQAAKLLKELLNAN